MKYTIEIEPSPQEVQDALQFLSSVAEYKTPEGEWKLSLLRHAVETDNRYDSSTMSDQDWKVETLAAQWAMLMPLLTSHVIEYPHIRIGGYNDFNCHIFDTSSTQLTVSFGFTFRSNKLIKYVEGIRQDLSATTETPSA